MVCCGALACLQNASPEELKGKNIGIFVATGMGNVDEILPFITQVFKQDGGFPSPNQFANSVSNAAAFFLARICDIKGIVLTVSQEEISFESALWLAQSYLATNEIELALVGGCDVFTPTTEDYRERMNLKPGNYRLAPMGEGSSWLLLSRNAAKKIGDILTVRLDFDKEANSTFSDERMLNKCVSLAGSALSQIDGQDVSRVFLPGFRMIHSDASFWQRNGWTFDDYLPHCGIHSTASAFGIARALVTRSASLIFHCNHQTSGRQALIAAAVK